MKTFDDLVNMGCIEYLDVNEMNNAFVAVYEKEIKMQTTHLDVIFLFISKHIILD